MGYKKGRLTSNLKNAKKYAKNILKIIKILKNQEQIKII